MNKKIIYSIIIIVIIISVISVILLSLNFFKFEKFNNISNQIINENSIIELLKDQPLPVVELKEQEAFIICLSDKLFDTAKKNIQWSSKLPILQKFDAIKGSELSETYIKSIITLKSQRDIYISPKRFSHADLGSKGAIGCSLSHASIWYNIVKNNLKGAYIFESDAVCTSVPSMELMENFFNKKGHLLFFGLLSSYKISSDDPIYKVNERFYGTHGYYITNEGARICLSYFFKIEQQIDSYLVDLMFLKLLDIYVLSKQICFQRNLNGSTIQTKGIYNIFDKQI